MIKQNTGGQFVSLPELLEFVDTKEDAIALINAKKIYIPSSSSSSPSRQQGEYSPVLTTKDRKIPRLVEIVTRRDLSSNTLERIKPILKSIPNRAYGFLFDEKDKIFLERFYDIKKTSHSLDERVNEAIRFHISGGTETYSQTIELSSQTEMNSQYYSSSVYNYDSREEDRDPNKTHYRSGRLIQIDPTESSELEPDLEFTIPTSIVISDSNCHETLRSIGGRDRTHRIRSKLMRTGDDSSSSSPSSLSRWKIAGDPPKLNRNLFSAFNKEKNVYTLEEDPESRTKLSQFIWNNRGKGYWCVELSNYDPRKELAVLYIRGVISESSDSVTVGQGVTSALQNNKPVFGIHKWAIVHQPIVWLTLLSATAWDDIASPLISYPSLVSLEHFLNNELKPGIQYGQVVPTDNSTVTPKSSFPTTQEVEELDVAIDSMLNIYKSIASEDEYNRELRQSVLSLQEQVAMFKKRLETAQSSVATEKEAKLKLQRALQEQSELYTASVARNTFLKRENDACRKNINEMEARLQKWIRDYDSQQTKLRQLTRDLEKNSKLADEETAKLKETIQKLEEERDELKVIEEQINQLISDKNDILVQLEKLNGRVGGDLTEKDREVITSELQSKLKQKNKQIDLLQKDIQEKAKASFAINMLLAQNIAYQLFQETQERLERSNQQLTRIQQTLTATFNQRLQLATDEKLELEKKLQLLTREKLEIEKKLGEMTKQKELDLNYIVSLETKVGAFTREIIQLIKDKLQLKTANLEAEQEMRQTQVLYLKELEKTKQLTADVKILGDDRTHMIELNDILTENIKVLEKDRRNMSDQMNQMRSDIAALKNTLSKRETSIAALNVRLRILRTEITNNNAIVNEIKQKYDEYYTRVGRRTKLPIILEICEPSYGNKKNTIQSRLNGSQWKAIASNPLIIIDKDKEDNLLSPDGRIDNDFKAIFRRNNDNDNIGNKMTESKLTPFVEFLRAYHEDMSFFIDNDRDDDKNKEDPGLKLGRFNRSVLGNEEKIRRNRRFSRIQLSSSLGTYPVFGMDGQKFVPVSIHERDREYQRIYNSILPKIPDALKDIFLTINKQKNFDKPGFGVWRPREYRNYVHPLPNSDKMVGVDGEKGRGKESSPYTIWPCIAMWRDGSYESPIQPAEYLVAQEYDKENGIFKRCFSNALKLPNPGYILINDSPLFGEGAMFLYSIPVNDKRNQRVRLSGVFGSCNFEMHIKTGHLETSHTTQRLVVNNNVVYLESICIVHQLKPK